MSSPARPSPGPAARPDARRRALTWLVSLAAGALFLWLASQRLKLWPDAIELPHPELVGLALALHVPYAWVRAMRLQFLLDPVVRRTTNGARARVSRRLVHGSGYVSFLVLLVLPLKLGELSRPLLLARGREPGLGVTESLSAVATERIVDGLMICAMLFSGLALSRELADDSASTLGDVQRIGQGMLALFGIGLVILWIAGRDPQAAGRLATRIVGVRAAGIVERVALSISALRDPACALPLVGWSVVYWAITTLQLWLVLHGCGLALSGASAAAIVAIVGLSIQLPGGPAQSGTFQVGNALALGLFLDAATQQGAGSMFTAVMYVLQLFGAAAMAMPGLWLLRRSEPEGNPA